MIVETLPDVVNTAQALTPSRGAPPPPDTEELVIVTGGQLVSEWTNIPTAVIPAGRPSRCRRTLDRFRPSRSLPTLPPAFETGA